MNRPVRLILDASAVRLFPSIDIGEPISELNQEGAGFGIPVVALATTFAEGRVHPTELLAKHQAFVPLELTMDRWRQVGATLGVVRDLAAAHAVIVAWEADCEILTTQPDLYERLGGESPIIPI